MKKNKKILIVLGLLISVLIILPFLVPVKTYLHEAELVASDKLGVPVTITSGHLSFLPSPRLIVSGIVVGKNQEFKVAHVAIIPTLTTLFSETKSIDLKVSQPIIKEAALDIVSALSEKKSEEGESAKVNVRHIIIDEMKLDWPNATIPIANLELNLTNDTKLESAILETVDGKLKADITPKGDEHLIEVNAKKWTPPMGLPLLIDKAHLQMHLKENRLEIPNIDVALYHGKLTGNAILTWHKDWRLNGHLKVDSVSVKEPTRLVNKSTYLSGNLFGNGKFSASAKDAGKLADNIRADFNFKVNDGVLHGLDLIQAASLFLKQGQSGGSTQFEEFSGLLNVSGKALHLRDLKISSGLLAANGEVKITPKKALDGVVVAELKHSVSMAAIPLQVSGTLSNPIVYPTKSAMAGAIAGTAILGPGVGTGLGMKAAGALDKLKGLFGGDE